MTEKKDSNLNSNSKEKSTIIVVLTVIVVLIGIIIAIPIVYATGRNSGQFDSAALTNASNYTSNECILPLTADAYHYYVNIEPFPFKYHNVLYRPSVVLKQITLFFGFNHNDKSWSIDKISVIDTTTQNDTINDGDFESNYLTLYYTRCVQSNTRTSTGDTLFDNPYSGDFYYNDQTFVGMAFLRQTINIIGGRYYNISYYLENRGYNNTFLFLIGYVKNN